MWAICQHPLPTMHQLINVFTSLDFGGKNKNQQAQTAAVVSWTTSWTASDVVTSSTDSEAALRAASIST